VTYKGDRATISSNTSTLVNESALIIANLIMFQKIANVLSIVSFVMVASMSGGAYFGYKYLTSENFKSQVMKEIMGNVSGLMPKVLDQGLPDMTGPSVPNENWKVPGVPKL
tara:strand:- start:32 stop:364 length:333 start_codon:yes stop_codon:yes gene_type:complete